MEQRAKYQDITKSLKNQIAQHIHEDDIVRKSEKKYRVLVENLPQKIFHKDRNSVYISCNKNYAHDLNITPEQIVGKTDYAFYNKELAEKYRTDDKRIMENGSVENIQEIYIRNGKEVVVQTVKAPIKNDEGVVIGVLGIFWDITEQKLAEENLKKSEEKYHKLIEYSNDAVISVDSMGKIVEFNQKAEKMFGYSREEMIGKPSYLLVAKRNRERQKKILYKLAEEGTKLEKGRHIFEGVGLKKSGDELHVEFSFYTIEINREVIGTASIRDISERKIAERKLMEYQQKLKSLTSQLTLAEEKERRHFAEYLHNEIGQNLFVFQLQLEQLKQSLTSADSIKTAQNILNNIKQVINNSRSLTFELSSPILYELGLEKALEWLVEQTYKQHNIVVTLQVDKQEKLLEDDMKVLLYQAVRELLINVWKHAKTKKATVSIEKDNSNMKVCVKDNGIGFDTSRLDAIDTMKDEFGLFHISERLEHLGGRFHIESKPNHGTKVTLLIPLVCNSEKQST